MQICYVPFSEWIAVSNGKRTARAIWDDDTERGRHIWMESKVKGYWQTLPFKPTHWFNYHAGEWTPIVYPREEK